MQNKKLLIVFTFIFVVGFLAWMLRPTANHDGSKKQNVVSLKTDTSSKENILNNKFLDDAKKMDEEIKNLDMSDISEDDLKQELHITPFQEVDISDIDTIKKKSDVEPVGGVFIAKGQISTLKVGDVVEVPLLGSSNYRVKITERKVNPSGSVSVSGNLVEDNKYSATFTEGKNSAYASITTPDGAYEVESVGGKGYIYSVSDVERKRVNPNGTDVLTVDR